MLLMNSGECSKYNTLCALNMLEEKSASNPGLTVPDILFNGMIFFIMKVRIETCIILIYFLIYTSVFSACLAELFNMVR